MCDTKKRKFFTILQRVYKKIAITLYRKKLKLEIRSEYLCNVLMYIIMFNLYFF